MAGGLEARWLAYSARTRIIVLLCAWQVLSALLACTSILTTELVNHNFSAPLIQSFGNYLLLAVVFIPWRIHRAQTSQTKPQVLEWWKFAFIAIADVEG